MICLIINQSAKKFDMLQAVEFNLQCNVKKLKELEKAFQSLCPSSRA